MNTTTVPSAKPPRPAPAAGLFGFTGDAQALEQARSESAADAQFAEHFRAHTHARPNTADKKPG